MSLIRFEWHRVRDKDGNETVHRWAANASRTVGGKRRQTLQQFHKLAGVTHVSGPHKTRKEALKK